MLVARYLTAPTGTEAPSFNSTFSFGFRHRRSVLYLSSRTAFTVAVITNEMRTTYNNRLAEVHCCYLNWFSPPPTTLAHYPETKVKWPVQCRMVDNTIGKWEDTRKIEKNNNKRLLIEGKSDKGPNYMTQFRPCRRQTDENIVRSLYELCTTQFCRAFTQF